ncbi:uncharacterized protein [Linepithema humile]|uniref:uncharacterized protein n=1 Tax=Linepithema humile TaxID=83485 RepID=UPI00351E7576
MSAAFWRKIIPRWRFARRKVSTKSLVSRSFKRPRILLPEELEDFIKEESHASRNCEMDIIPGFLSNKKSQVKHALNEFLKFPRQLLAPHIVLNFVTSPRNFSTAGNNSITSDWPFMQRNVDREITTRLKRWKSAQSSCEKDSQNSQESRKCIEDHRQSAESCKKGREKCNNDNRISAESCRKSGSDLPSHREHCRSIESSTPVHSDKPAPYNDRQACESTKRDSRKATRITCESWTRGKPATEKKIYHKCKPKPCTYPHSRKKTIPSSLYSPEDCSKEKPADLKKISKQTATALSCPQSKLKPPSCTKTIESKKPSTCPAPSTEEHEPDPPPPRYPHWTENPPSYCDRYSKKTTCPSFVKSSPIIFIPKKAPQKSRAKDTTPSFQNIHKNKNECSKTDIKTRISQSRKSLMRTCIPRRAISFEDKCADSLTLPAPVDKMKQEIQWFPTLTKEGQCRVKKPEEKKFVMSDVDDCKPNIASYKYRLSKCPCLREIQNTDVDQKSPVDVGMQQRQGNPLSRDKETNELELRETAKRKRKRVKLHSKMQQKYKVRLKTLQKRDKRLDPRPSRIAELRQSRDGKMRSPLSKQFRSVTEEGKLSPRLRNPCSDYCPPERPVVEHKSYPTKMDESRAIHGRSLEKSSRTKRR